jgi:putative transposase
VVFLQEEFQVSERRACRTLEQNRSTQKYQPKRPDMDRALVEKILEAAAKHPRYGYRRITALLRNEGWNVNRKRVYRLWKKEGKQVSARRKKHRFAGEGKNACHLNPSGFPNDVWTYDFLFDQTMDGRTLKVLVILDEFTRRCIHIEVARRINHKDIWRLLQKLFIKYERPGRIRSDNGSEFIAHHLKQCFDDFGVQTLHIAPGSPWQNGYAESFISHFKNEFLNRELFGTLLEAQVLIKEHQRHYNEERPHSSLKYRTPNQFYQHYIENNLVLSNMMV